MKKLEGKRALVTGAGSDGIGAQVCRLYAQEGADLVIHYHSNDIYAEEVRKECESYGVKAFKYKADCSEEEEVKAMVDFVVEKLGGIDILVASTGINNQVPVKDMSYDVWRRMIKVNLDGVFLCDRYVLPHMLKQKSGRIINIASQLGQIGSVDGAHYAASKGGVIAFTKSLAREVSKDGVLCNCIAPGPVWNKFFWEASAPEWQEKKLASLPMGRFGKNENVAPSAVLLASSPDGDDYCGQTLGPNCGDVML